MTQKARATFCGCDFPVGFIEPKIEFWNSMKDMSQVILIFTSFHFFKNMGNFLKTLNFGDLQVDNENKYSKEKISLKNLQGKLAEFYIHFGEIVGIYGNVTCYLYL
jgi:hypothetical protein